MDIDDEDMIELAIRESVVGLLSLDFLAKSSVTSEARHSLPEQAGTLSRIPKDVLRSTIDSDSAKQAEQVSLTYRYLERSIVLWLAQCLNCPLVATRNEL